MSGTHRSRHDVVVVGARCAGAATAMLLARMGHDVVVVDKARLPSDTLSTHGILRGGVVQLARWGLLDAVLASGAPAIEQVTFDIAGEVSTRRIKERAGVDLLLAPRRHVLDGLLADAAVASGADLRTGVTATGLLRSADGRVGGITARTSTGERIELSADYVVGADGRRSRMAEYVGAEVLEQVRSSCSAYYTYVADLGSSDLEFHIAPGALAGVFPTHGGEACVWLIRPTARFGLLRTPGGGRVAAFLDELELVVPSLADRVRAGRVTAPIRSAVDLPNYLRRPYGDGWALVGDAGYHRDPITGHGITDAYRDAELLATAIDRALRQPRFAHDAMAAYQHTRDVMVREVFDLTLALTRFPAPDRFVELQIELSEALEREADLLAALPRPWAEPVGSAA
jgi:flavin-dependent dehydrogenase